MKHSIYVEDMLTSHTHTHTLHTYKARTLAFPQVCAQFHMAKEAYSYGKRGLFICQKRPIHMAKEAYEHWLPRTAYERGRQHDGRL